MGGFSQIPCYAEHRFPSLSGIQVLALRLDQGVR